MLKGVANGFKFPELRVANGFKFPELRISD
jgi:hypothetical protein